MVRYRFSLHLLVLALIVAGGALLAIFIRDWARRLAGWVGGIAIIAQARHARTIRRMRSRFPRGPRHRNLESQNPPRRRVCISQRTGKSSVAWLL